MLTVFGINLNT